MSMLKALNIVALPKLTKNDPLLQRRVKLLTQLEQQRELAANPAYSVLTKKWVKQEDGSKTLVDKQKRVKKWWVVDVMGNCFFTIRYGSKLLELEKVYGEYILERERLTDEPKKKSVKKKKELVLEIIV